MFLLGYVFALFLLQLTLTYVSIFHFSFNGFTRVIVDASQEDEECEAYLFVYGATYGYCFLTC
jgi:hypothetical protein